MFVYGLSIFSENGLRLPRCCLLMLSTCSILSCHEIISTIESQVARKNLKPLFLFWQFLKFSTNVNNK